MNSIKIRRYRDRWTPIGFAIVKHQRTLFISRGVTRLRLSVANKRDRKGEHRAISIPRRVVETFPVAARARRVFSPRTRNGTHGALHRSLVPRTRVILRSFETNVPCSTRRRAKDTASCYATTSRRIRRMQRGRPTRLIHRRTSPL